MELRSDVVRHLALQAPHLVRQPRRRMNAKIVRGLLRKARHSSCARPCPLASALRRELEAHIFFQARPDLLAEIFCQVVSSLAFQSPLEIICFDKLTINFSTQCTVADRSE